MSLKSKLSLESALVSTGMVQPVDGKVKGGHLEVLCRQVPGQESGWVGVVDQLLGLSVEGVELHLCRRYLHKDGQMVFGWHVQVDCASGRALAAAVDVLVATLNQARPALSPVGSRSGAVLGPAVSSSNLATVVPPPADPTPGRQVRPAARFRPGYSENGTAIMEVAEMQLPHVDRDINVPNAKGKGARWVGSNDEDQRRR